MSSTPDRSQGQRIQNPKSLKNPTVFSSPKRRDQGRQRKRERRSDFRFWMGDSPLCDPSRIPSGFSPQPSALKSLFKCPLFPTFPRTLSRLTSVRRLLIRTPGWSAPPPIPGPVSLEIHPMASMEKRSRSSSAISKLKSPFGDLLNLSSNPIYGTKWTLGVLPNS